MADRYNSIDNTSPILKSLQDEKPKVKRSAFDFSNTVIGQLQLGAIIPIDLIRFVPNENFEVSYDLKILSRNPLLRKILTTQRCYVHTYIQYDRNMWEGARNQKTRGYSGNISLEVPYIQEDKDWTCFTPMSLANYLGIPIHRFADPTKRSLIYSYAGVNFDNSSTVPDISSGTVINPRPEKINALPFVMYQQICRDYFFNSNLLYNSKDWYPENQEHFLLPYEAKKVWFLDYYNATEEPFEALIINGESSYYVPLNTTYSPVFLPALHFRQRKGDRFTTALPFPDLIRGDIPFIDVSLLAKNLDDFVVPSAYTGTLSTNSLTDVSVMFPNKIESVIDSNLSNDTISRTQTYLSLEQYHGGSLSDAELIKRAYGVKVQDIASKIVANSLSLNDIRTLQAYTIFKERSALAKGDYNSLIEAQFGYDPHIQGLSPIYIGGFYQDILFSEVVQQSESSSDSQLGQKASNAYSSSQGYIGKFHTKDFGYMMTVLSIVPDSFYTQGLDPMWSGLNQEDVYFPILNDLPPQAILNKELFISGQSDVDNDVFGYTERYSEYKSRQNRVVGLSALGESSLYDSALVQKNIFEDTPVLNNQFMTLSPKNIDMSIYSVTDEPPYDFYCQSRIDRVGPFPYRAIPKGVI